MTNRVSLVVLYEDEMHETVVRAFLAKSGLSRHNTRPLREGKKSDVIAAFAREVRALRRTDVATRLVVLIDGDELSDSELDGLLKRKLREADLDEDYRKDAVLILRPRWELENWVLYLLGESAGEDRDLAARKRIGDRGREAGRLLADTCASGRLPAAPPPSLVVACAEWKAFRQTHGF